MARELQIFINARDRLAFARLRGEGIPTRATQALPTSEPIGTSTYAINPR